MSMISPTNLTPSPFPLPVETSATPSTTQGEQIPPASMAPKKEWLPVSSNWEALPMALISVILELIPDCGSYASALDTCRNWNKSYDFPPKKGALSISQFRDSAPQDSEFCDLLRVLRKHKIVNPDFAITSFYAVGCREITRVALKALKGFPITEMDISYSSINTLKPLREMPLVSLGLRGMAFQDKDLEPLASILTLKNLGLSQCEKITTLKTLKGLSLTTLDLSLCKITKLEFLKDHSSLEELDISSCTKIQPDQLHIIQSHPALKKIDARYCNFKEASVKEICKNSIIKHGYESDNSEYDSE